LDGIDRLGRTVRERQLVAGVAYVLRHVVEIAAQKKAGWFSDCSPGDGSGSSSATA